MAGFIEKASGAVNAMKHPQDLLGSAASKSKNTIKNALIGSGSIPEEAERLKKAYLGDPDKPDEKGMFLNAASSVGKLVTGHPIKAIGKARDSFVDMVDAVTAAPRFLVAGGAETGRTVEKAAEKAAQAPEAILKSPFYAFNTLIDTGPKKLEAFATSAASAISRKTKEITTAGKAA